jgi:hypothetical protein
MIFFRHFILKNIVFKSGTNQGPRQENEEHEEHEENRIS